MFEVVCTLVSCTHKLANDAMPPASRQISTPPDRGSFPLDNNNDCKSFVAEYKTCLQRSKGWSNQGCLKEQASYLECRMDKGLMPREELKKLGFANSQKHGPGRLPDGTYKQ
jgi:hypothetical protein